MSKHTKNFSDHWVSMFLPWFYICLPHHIRENSNWLYTCGISTIRNKRNKDPLDIKNSHKTWQFTKTNIVQWLQGETVVRVEKLALFSRGARRFNSTSRPLHKFLPTELRKQFDPQLKRNQLFRLLFWNSNRFEFVVSFKKTAPREVSG